MDSIGSENFVFVQGPLDYPGYTFRNITREGADGIGIAEEGIRGVASSLIAGRDYTNASAAESALLSYKGMLGTVVTISQYGGNRGNLWLILEVKEHPGSRVTSTVASGGIADGLHWMETVWTVQWAGDGS